MKSNKGYMLIETLIGLVLFGMLSIAGTSLLLHVNEVSGKLKLKSDLLENARITLDFITTQLRYCEVYKLERLDDGSLKRLTVWTNGEETDVGRHEFIYDKAEGTVLFGNNVLAQYIEDIWIEDKEDIMEIKITTQTKIIAIQDALLEPVELKAKIDLTHKGSR